MTDNTELPHGGSMSMEELCRAISQSPAERKTTKDVACRTILIRSASKDAWTHVASVFVVGRQDSAQPTIVTAGPLCLIKSTLECQDFSSEAALTKATQYWHALVGSADDVGGYQQPSCYWMASRNTWGPDACWQVSVSGITGQLAIDSARGAGPFFNSESRFGATDLRDVGRQWLGLADFPDSYSISVPVVRFVLPDGRARIDDIALFETRIDVSAVRQTAEDVLFARFEGLDYDGRVHRDVVKLVGSMASFDPKRVLRQLRIELWTGSDQLLDSFLETENGSPWGVSVLTPRVPKPSDEGRDLGMALVHGESETVEFKPFVRLGDGEKRLELFKTVVAFGNHKGGIIYLGVNDHLEVVGITPDFHKSLKGAGDKPPEEMRDQYMRDLKQAIGQAVTPSLIIRTQWLEYANQWVLRVEVPAGVDRPYALFNGSGIWLRRGSNNVQAGREDWEEIYRQKSATQQDPRKAR